ncbi:hypothetical protein RRV45_12270 [Bacillus sp. DTU_2020_1000418_1_SI_GHA_SEK_038]|uniref:hypothetical protein n=1 Tax=Bacillus sp. DTU_2020_1000418_1_SI_GHA_SEK_038 TaxID=3077585 RepID=UPI0028EE7676|nr:hypothetical protein [Bacillus sp. DTU_2020_1000418_1_SI_GHA_SEK_038]WNS73694.1 hypothetical protein RRV45_12270 [Bacillus sp. DTU_2020_1000418_1_SI_GHA_SEK_038]
MKKKIGKVLKISISTLVLSFSFATVSSAHYCYVANKKDGAGAVTEEDIKQAGNSGKFVAPGAFFDVGVDGVPDLFIRGGTKGSEFVVGGGSLHDSPATERGSKVNGVQKLSEEE